MAIKSSIGQITWTTADGKKIRAKKEESNVKVTWQLTPWKNVTFADPFAWTANSYRESWIPVADENVWKLSNNWPSVTFADPFAWLQEEYKSQWLTGSSFSSTTPSQSTGSKSTTPTYTSTYARSGLGYKDQIRRNNGKYNGEYTDITTDVNGGNVLYDEFGNPLMSRPEDINAQAEPEVGSEAWIAKQREIEWQKAIQREKEDIQRAWQQYDRWVENLDINQQRSQEKLDINQQRWIEDRAFNIEQYKKNVSRNIEDTTKQKEQTLQNMRKMWGVLWLNVTSTFTSNYQDVVEKFNKAVNRMYEDQTTAEWRNTLESERDKADYERATKNMLETYQMNMQRHQEDFNYAMRDYKESAIIDANALVAKYGLDDVKLWERLRDVTLDAFNKVNVAYGSYLDNVSKETDIMNDQATYVLEQKAALREDQRAVLNEFIAGSANRTLVELNAMVANWQISEEAANMALGEIVTNTVETLNTKFEIFAPWIWYMFNDQIVEWINAWKTPNQVLQEVVQSQDFKQAMKDAAANDPFFSTKLAQAQENLKKTRQDYTQSEWEYKMKQEEYDRETWKVVPTGNIVVNADTGRALDAVAMPSFENAYKELQEAWFTDMVFAPGHRDQMQTIMKMASKHWIPYNENDPNATAAALRAAWHQVADVGSSDHETWMAIDIYADWHLHAPTPEQVKILNNNWFYQTAWANDMWHFEYIGWWTSNNPGSSQLFYDIELMNGAQRTKYLDENNLRWAYDSWKENRKSNESKYTDLQNLYYSTLNLWVGISDADRDLIMHEFNKGMEMWDEGMMKSAIYKGMLTKNKENKTVYDMYKRTIENINIMQEATQRYKSTPWADTWILEGSLEEIAQKIGNTTDPNLASIQSAVDAITADYLRDVSGTAVSDVERQFIQSFLPNIKRIGKLNDVFSENFITRLKNNAEVPLKSTMWQWNDYTSKVWNDVFSQDFDIVKWEDNLYRTKRDMNVSNNIITQQTITTNPEYDAIDNFKTPKLEGKSRYE